MELLAPAGSKEAFIAALKAGADSVYVGVDSYNARLNADTFRLYDLEVVIDHAHSRNKKIYLALNTLIKHGEIDDVVKRLYKISKFKPDAFIVQDTGIAAILKEQFPEIPLHASTQMAVHNSYGVEALSGLGFRRVILARELSSAELKLIARKSPAELEIFCHGALCFCISGMCFFSSVIGAHSGNRGRCTQPCRRLWETDGKRGYYFSPRDLELARHLNELKELGIKALKIEGRMRSSEYVSNAVKAYRSLIDAEPATFGEALKEAEKLLACDYAREKTTFLFPGKAQGLFKPQESQCLGRRIGVVTCSKPGIVSIKSAEALKKWDRLRISDPKNDITVSLKLSELPESADTYDIPLREGVFPAGSPVYKAGDSLWNEKELTKEVDEMYASYAKKTRVRAKPAEDYSNRYTALIARQWIIRDKYIPEHYWIKIDDPGWLDIIPGNANNFFTVFSLKRENLHLFRKIAAETPSNRKNILCELPPFISQRELPEYRQAIDEIIASGINRWVLNNISHFGFFRTPGIEFTAGHFLYAWNAFSARALKDLGVTYFVTSWEDDFLNIRGLAGSGLRGYLVVYLYGYPPVARSRMVTKETHREGIYSDGDIRFRLIQEEGSGVLIPVEPVMLFNAHDKILGLGVRNFGIDLSYLRPEKQFWKDIFSAYREQENFPASIKFNFKKLVK